ncbi:MAG: sulfite exporter TauE/SafE family protein [Clostridia bacterium]|nr:sulfite exporter TauE/SafE family protein [Clostridia bacterium]
MIFWNIFAGFISGVFGGMGMGGGTLLIPILSIFFGFEQKVCQWLNLMTFLVMAVVAMYIHYRHGLIKTRGLFLVVLSGIIFAVIGAFLATFLPSEILKKCFGGFLVLLSVFYFIKVIKN